MDPKPLIPETDIRRRVSELAAQISHDYAGKKDVALLGVLKGAFIFLADLARQVTVPHRVEFVALSSYGEGTVSSGQVRVGLDLRNTIEGSHVVVIEDIVDTGRTLRHLIDLLETRGPASVAVCSLVRKQDRHEVEAKIDYLGFDIPDVFVVGYGLDYAEQYRTLPYIGIVEPSGS
jgi:hypoxanthine phosphoribosyltransferase